MKSPYTTCPYCGGTVLRSAMTLDHIIPRSRGGRTTVENTIRVCLPCNRAKDDLIPADPLWDADERRREFVAKHGG